MRQSLNPHATTWHITWGTYGTRLHGGTRPTVDRPHNERGKPFVPRDPDRERRAAERMKFAPVYLTRQQCLAVQEAIPALCDKGGWTYRVASASLDHVHVLCDIDRVVHGEKVRRLLKRWIGQALSRQWLLPEGASWWAEEGSNKAVRDEDYLTNAFGYIRDQRTT